MRSRSMEESEVVPESGGEVTEGARSSNILFRRGREVIDTTDECRGSIAACGRTDGRPSKCVKQFLTPPIWDPESLFGNSCDGF